MTHANDMMVSRWVCPMCEAVVHDKKPRSLIIVSPKITVVYVCTVCKCKEKRILRARWTAEVIINGVTVQDPEPRWDWLVRIGDEDLDIVDRGLVVLQYKSACKMADAIRMAVWNELKRRELDRLSWKNYVEDVLTSARKSGPT